MREKLHAGIYAGAVGQLAAPTANRLMSLALRSLLYYWRCMGLTYHHSNREEVDPGRCLATASLRGFVWQRVLSTHFSHTSF